MALSITGGASSYQLREPSVLNTPNAHRQLLNGFQLNDSNPGSKEYTLVIVPGAGSEIQLANGNPVTGTDLTKSGTLGQLTDWLDSLFLAAQDVELGNTSVNTSLSFTLSSDDSNDSAAPRTVNANITPSNDPTTIPVALELVVDEATTANVDGTISGDAHAGIGAPEGVLKIRDPEVGAGSQQPSQIIYRVESVPEHGFLKLGTTVLGIGSVFTHQDVIAGNVTYEHTSRGPTENQNDSFEVTVNDGATSVDWSNTNARSIINITVTPTNQPPEAENASGHVYENQPYNWEGSSVGQYITAYAGVDDTRKDRDPGDALTIIITDLPENGILYYNGSPVAVGAEIPYDQRENITYGHDGDDPDSDPEAVDAFKFKVRDSGDLESDEATVNLTVRPVNDIPVSTGDTNFSATVDGVDGTENGYIVNLRDVFFPDDAGDPKLAIDDPDNEDDELFFVLDTGPVDDFQGWIFVDGQLLPPNGRFSLQDVRDGKVTFEQKAYDPENPSHQFTFKVIDNAVSPRWDGDGEQFYVPGGVYPENSPSQGNTFDDLQDFTVTFELDPGWGAAIGTQNFRKSTLRSPHQRTAVPSSMGTPTVGWKKVVASFWVTALTPQRLVCPTPLLSVATTCPRVR